VVGDPEVHPGHQIRHALAGFEEGALGQDLFPRRPYLESYASVAFLRDENPRYIN
jgi:hypothetical protein